MPLVCTSCRKNGFQWNRNYCSYCGAPRPEAAPAEDDALRKKVLVPLAQEAVPVELETLPTPGWSCPSCKREGFKWNRNYCSYCGYVHPEIDPTVAADARRQNDVLYDQALQQHREAQARRGNPLLGADGGFDSSSVASGFDPGTAIDLAGSIGGLL